MKITSILLWVQDSELSVKFYKKLGFEVASSTDSVSVVRLQGFEITLVAMREDPEFTRDSLHGDKGRGMYIYVLVDDVDAKHKELTDKGVEPTSTPRDWEWGNREFVIKDLDGYKLCFWQPLKK